MPSGIDPKVDYAFKWVFGREPNKPLLIDLLNAVLQLLPGQEIVGIELLNPFTARSAADEKLSILDIRARDQMGRLFNIEMQMLGFAALPQRILFYWSKMYTEQLPAGREYSLLQPTISVCFVDGSIFAGAEYHARYGLIDRATGRVFTEDLEIHLFELAKFNKGAAELETTLDQWLYFLRNGEELDENELPATIKDEAVRQAVEELMGLSKRDLEREIYEGREKMRRDENARMQHALQQGLLQGRQQGRQEGELIGQVLLLQSLLGRETTDREVLQSMPLEEVQQLRDQLQQQLNR
jgi:predicted transposase/invertase (TIGR01784 family)